MATKIRLQRRGHRHYAFYAIVVADSRAPRDGKFIEKIGTYNPNTDPCTVDLKFDRALYWLEVGAQPTDRVNNILSFEGVLLMKHLRGGVRKGAFDEATAQARFDAWKAEKLQKLEAKKAGVANKVKAVADARLAQEKETHTKMAERIAEKKAAESKALAEAAAAAAKEAAEAEAPAAEESTEAAS